MDSRDSGWIFWVIFNHEAGNAVSPLFSVCDCKQNTCSYALNFTKKTQGVFILTDAEVPHSTHVSLKKLEMHKLE